MKKIIVKALYYIGFIKDNILGLGYLLNKRNFDYKELKVGQDKYPKCIKLNKLLAFYECEHKNWENALHYWKALLPIKKRFTVKEFKLYLTCLKKTNRKLEYSETLKLANEKYPKDLDFISNLAQVYKEMENWSKIILYLEKYNKLSTSGLETKDLFWLNYCYIKTGKYSKGKLLLNQSINAMDNIDNYIQFLIERKDWELAISYVESLDKHQLIFERKITLSMLYFIMGDGERARSEFDAVLNNKESVEFDEKKYRKIILFDNGDSRIEFYKNFKSVNSVIVTFDSINMEWDKPSFAFKLLLKQNLDIIAIRKRKAKTYQQDLKVEDFLTSTKHIVSLYEDRLAYGFSLGAYNALYFSSLLNCRILSISPRLSIHPKYGRKNIMSKYKMKQNVEMPKNKFIQPIIVFDPKNKLDNKYINEGILPYFPKASLIKVPYGGHGMAPHLLKMGLLKDFLFDFIDGKVPYYDRKRRVKSNVYYRNLSSECVRHNKLKWALSLVNNALDIENKDFLSLKLKLKIYKKMKEYKLLEKHAIEFIQYYPRRLDLQLYLIDAQLELGTLAIAEASIEQAISKFGNKENIKKRILYLESLKSKGIKGEL